MPAALTAYLVLSLGSMATMSIGIGLVVLATLAAMARGWRLRLSAEERAMFWAGMALTWACIVSLAAADTWPPNYGGKTSVVDWASELPKFWYLLAPPFLSAAFRSLSPAWHSRAIRVWIYAMGVFSLVCFVQFFTGWPRPQGIPGFPPYFHMTGFLGHHLSLASIWIFPAFVALSLWREEPVARRALGVAGVLGVVALIGTFSRTLWVALPVGLGIWAIVAGGRILPRRALAATAAVLIALIAATQVPAIRDRYTSLYNFNERAHLWEANLSFAADRPLVGVGFRHNQELAAYYLQEKLGTQDVFTGHAHNNLIDMLGGTGLLGALAWLAWCAVFTVLVWRRARQGSALAWGVFCAWIVFQLNGLTQVNFWEGKVEHQLMIALALVLSEPRT